MAGNENTTVPVINISPFASSEAHDEEARAVCSLEWDKAMREFGFAYIVGHGVEKETVESARSAFKAFFEQSAAYKSQFCHGGYGNPMGGYSGVGTEAVARSQDGHGGLGLEDNKAAAPDPVESYTCRLPSEWVTSLPPLAKEVAVPAAEYYKQMRRLVDCLKTMSTAALGLSPDYFEPFYTPEPECYLVAKSYPPAPQGRLRFGAHTDYTGYTILKQDDADGSPGAGGLEVLLKSGEWLRVTPLQNAFVVNLGDLYEDWTNGRWRSTVHRVASPEPGSEAATATRLSLPFFSGPHNGAVITTIPTCVSRDVPDKLLEPTTAGEHLIKKFSASQVEAASNA